MPLFIVQRDFIAHLVALLLPVGVAGAVIGLGCLLFAFSAFRRGDAEKGGIGIAGWLVASVLSLAAGFGQNWVPMVICVGTGLVWAIATVAIGATLRVRAWNAGRVNTQEAREPAPSRGEEEASARMAPRRGTLETAGVSAA